jgi:hypothetical protein
MKIPKAAKTFIPFALVSVFSTFRRPVAVVAILNIVTCYLLTRRIIMGCGFIGYISSGVTLADYTSNPKSHKPVTSSGSYS